MFLPSYSLWIEATRFHRPIGSLLLATPMLLAFSIAPNLSWGLRIYLLILCVATRSLGCVINDYADQDIDRLVQRTQLRPFARNHIPRSTIFLMVGVLSLLCMSCFLVLPERTFSLCLCAPFWIVSYAYAKRWCPAPQFILGIAFSWSILIIGQINDPIISLSFWKLFIANTLWVTGFDTTYALSDYSDDKNLPIYSLTKTLTPEISRYFSAIFLFITTCYINFFFIPHFGIFTIPSLCYSVFICYLSLRNTAPPLNIFYHHGMLGMLWVVQACLA